MRERGKKIITGHNEGNENGEEPKMDGKREGR